jgi:hypothetical protein
MSVGCSCASIQPAADRISVRRRPIAVLRRMQRRVPAQPNIDHGACGTRLPSHASPLALLFLAPRCLASATGRTVAVAASNLGRTSRPSGEGQRTREEQRRRPCRHPHGHTVTAGVLRLRHAGIRGPVRGIVAQRGEISRSPLVCRQRGHSAGGAATMIAFARSTQMLSML